MKTHQARTIRRGNTPILRTASLAVAIAAAALTVAACRAPSEAQFAGNTAATGDVPMGRPAMRPDLTPGANVVGVNCDTADCQASCLAGSSILLAYGFHGRSYDSNGPVSPKCGEAMEWLGGCVGQESCSVSTPCKSSALYLICR